MVVSQLSGDPMAEYKSRTTVDLDLRYDVVVVSLADRLSHLAHRFIDLDVENVQYRSLAIERDYSLLMIHQDLVKCDVPVVVYPYRWRRERIHRWSV
jgi:hypothetical protein